MYNITKTLLKHGVEGIISENEDFFKQNIEQALAIKLNETVKEIKNDFNQKTLVGIYNESQETQELKEFLDFLDDNTNKTLNFKNGSSINITEANKQDLIRLFESLNLKNRQMMVSEIFKDAQTFKNHLEFSQKVKVLI